MNILTFDIEDWFHILDHDSTKTEQEWSHYECRLDKNVDRIFEALEEKDLKATFFCVGWVVRKYPEIIKKIDSYGHEIASHSDLHQLTYQQSRDEFKSDLEHSIKSIEDVVGKKVVSYRAPGFSIKEENKWAFEEIIRLGIERDSSIFPAKRAHGGFEKYGDAEPGLIDFDGHLLKEFPINLYPIAGRNMIFSGGGYFRLLPYWTIKRMMKDSGYVMTYFHPRDFDPGQPVIADLSLLRKFKSYYGLSSAYRKLNHLLDDFEFLDLKGADEQIDWGRQKVFRL